MEEKVITNPIKAIRAKCLDCSNGSPNEVTLCPVQQCPLWPFRSGKNPYRTKRELTDEQREKAAERLRNLTRNRTGKENAKDEGV